MFTLAAAMAVIGLLTLGAAIIARRLDGRLPPSLIAEYAPAKGSTVLGDAILAGREDRAPAAALLDLAARRRVRLLTDGTNAKRPTVGVEVIDPDALSTLDTRLLDTVLGPAHAGRRIRRFSKDAAETRGRIRELLGDQASALERAGMIRGISRARPTLRAFAWLAAAGAVVLLFAGFVILGDGSGWIVLLAAIGCLAAAFVVTPRGPSRRFTDASVPARRHLDGLRQYMVLAESDRIRTLQSPRAAELQPLPESVRDDEDDAGRISALARFRLYEKLLPYAVIFGIEKQWVANLTALYGELDAKELSVFGAIDFAVDLFIIAEFAGGLVDLTFTVADAGSGAGDAIGAFDWMP